MKPEPLKDSEWWLHHIYNDAGYTDRKKKKQTLAVLRGYTKGDVKSAVEWLKQELEEFCLNRKAPLDRRVIEIIDEAFPDLKEKEGKS